MRVAPCVAAGASCQLPLSYVFSLVVGTGIWRQTVKQVSLAASPVLGLITFRVKVDLF